MRKIIFLLFLLFSGLLQAQHPEKLNSSEIFEQIQKLNFLGSALYIAAHPDDENTRLISYFSNELKARTAYLSMTRGDGGQNLIGPELRELLGVIRTQELLAARRIDGGEQFFTRANDFGYSKNPKETLNLWNKEEILKDVVRTIRKFQPDVIINRFNAGSAGETHGHHTSSAILSTEAFELAGNPAAFPELTEEYGTWQPKKLFFNTSPWFYKSQQAFNAADKSNFLEFDTGVYFPLKGLSNTEIASISRSQHRSQGFGSTGSRGQTPEYLELLKGEQPKGNDSLFAGINTTWSRIKGGKEIGDMLTNVENNFDFKNPAASLQNLVRAYQLIQNLENTHWKSIKTEEIKEIIAATAGLYLEAATSEALVTPGETVSLEVEAINRSAREMKLLSVNIQPVEKKIIPDVILENNQNWRKNFEIKIPENANFTNPYWLNEKGSLGMYKVANEDFIGLPETPRKFKAEFTVEIEGVEIPFLREIVFKANDPVKGEIYRPFEIVPQISVATDTDVLIFANGKAKEISVRIKAERNGISGTLKPKSLQNWKISPASYDFKLVRKGEEQSFVFEITAPKQQENAIFEPVIQVDGKTYSKEIVELDYEHIPVQTLVLPAETKLVKLNIEKRGKLIGYIEGAGDVVPQALEQIGYTVQTVPPEEISAENLKKFDAVVLGIRAYNVVEELRQKQDELFKYVFNGGNMIVQYNTSRGFNMENFAPFPLQLSHDRVTDEAAKVTFLTPNHPVLNVPNKISQKDFEGWVQERGLYFSNEWSSEFTPVLSMHDEGESAKKGSLLIAPYGKGNYIYTGLSFFREFPEGVPGAFRLFANLISLGKPAASTTTQNNSN